MKLICTENEWRKINMGKTILKNGIISGVIGAISYIVTELIKQRYTSWKFKHQYNKAKKK